MCLRSCPTNKTISINGKKEFSKAYDLLTYGAKPFVSDYAYDLISPGDCTSNALALPANTKINTIIDCLNGCSAVPGCKGASYNHTTKSCVLRAVDGGTSCTRDKTNGFNYFTRIN